MLQIELKKGPLSENEYQIIHRDYCKLKGEFIEYRQFVNWQKNGPSGPAIHALLLTDKKEIVGHYTIFPFPTKFKGKSHTAGKGEYLYVKEEYRKLKVENSRRPPALDLVISLYRYYEEHFNWSPIILSAPPKIDVIHRMAGAKKIEFKLHECLFTFNPLKVLLNTKNVSLKKRIVLFFIGLVQKIFLFIISFLPTKEALTEIEISNIDYKDNCNDEKLELPLKKDFLKWRYHNVHYSFFKVYNDPQKIIIAKVGDDKNYFRVAQTNIETINFNLICDLIKKAKNTKSIGLRWAIYENSNLSHASIKILKKMGFICPKRTRTIQIYGDNKDFLNNKTWDINDSYFSFDH